MHVFCGQKAYHTYIVVYCAALVDNVNRWKGISFVQYVQQ